MSADSPRPVAVTLGVPTFTPKELHKQLDAVLGKGASGTVYSLRDFPGLAVKEILLDGLDQRSIDAAKLELATLPALSHPGILRYHQVIEDGNFIYIVMDRHDGTLECLLIEHKRKKTHVSNRLICSIARQIAAALTYLSSANGVDAKGKPFKGLVHRNLKPINILVAADREQFILADFGLCKDALRSGTTLAGTKPYMAPETLLYNSTSPASDIWSLGVIIYELATLLKSNFLEGKEPKDVFINGWKPDLSAVEDDSIRIILEKIFVLDPVKRPTARDLCKLLRVSDVSVVEMKLRGMMLEEALNKANARIASLERELQTNSSDICALKSTIAAQAAEIDSLKSELKTKSTKIDAPERQLADIVKNLAKLNCHTPIKDSSWTPLMCAAVAGDIETAKRHLNEVDERNNDGDTAYTLAAKAGQGAILELLDPTDRNGVTALMRAAERGDVRTVRALMPLQKGKATGYVMINGWPISHGTALMRAAAHGYAEVVRLLVEHEEGMHDDAGWTALMFAVIHDHTECVKLLIEKEAGMQDKDGWTALMRAAINGHIECVKLLLEKEGGMKDKNGRTALMGAAWGGHLECVRLLLEHEGGMRDNCSYTALMSAAQSGHTECVKLFVEKEAGMQDEDGQTALMYATYNNRLECARLLAEREKDMKTTCECWGFPSGTTALDIAKKRGRTEIISILSG
ncbi:Ankyrin repeat protein [Giardia duodenalis]|uniref:Ankyrin repeat protein n=2 Tax=Giardia intestinalis TaxID=5741 RepID=V6TTI0_GIAIN|nr:Ankyrin repeat protein [Giardia intestinalis]